MPTLISPITSNPWRWYKEIQPLREAETLTNITYGFADRYRPHFHLDKQLLFSGRYESEYKLASILPNFNRVLARNYNGPETLGCNNEDNPALSAGYIDTTATSSSVSTTVHLRKQQYKDNENPCFFYQLNGIDSILHIWATPYRGRTEITYDILIPYRISVDKGIEIRKKDISSFKKGVERMIAR